MHEILNLYFPTHIKYRGKVYVVLVLYKENLFKSHIGETWNTKSKSLNFLTSLLLFLSPLTPHPTLFQLHLPSLSQCCPCPCVLYLFFPFQSHHFPLGTFSHSRAVCLLSECLSILLVSSVCALNSTYE